jgi:hypothetical protein
MVRSAPTLNQHTLQGFSSSQPTLEPIPNRFPTNTRQHPSLTILRYMADKLLYGIGGKALGKQMGTVVPSEPMYLILNTAMSVSYTY